MCAGLLRLSSVSRAHRKAFALVKLERAPSTPPSPRNEREAAKPQDEPRKEQPAPAAASRAQQRPETDQDSPLQSKHQFPQLSPRRSEFCEESTWPGDTLRQDKPEIGQLAKKSRLSITNNAERPPSLHSVIVAGAAFSPNQSLALSRLLHNSSFITVLVRLFGSLCARARES